MRVFEYLSYLKTVAPQLKFSEVVFYKTVYDPDDGERNDFFSPPFELSCNKSDYYWYLNQKIVSEDAEIFFLPKNYDIGKFGGEYNLSDEISENRYICIHVNELY